LILENDYVQIWLSYITDPIKDLSQWFYMKSDARNVDVLWKFFVSGLMIFLIVLRNFKALEELVIIILDEDMVLCIQCFL